MSTLPTLSTLDVPEALETAWTLVHGSKLTMRDAARRLGVDVLTIGEMLAERSKLTLNAALAAARDSGRREKKAVLLSGRGPQSHCPPTPHIMKGRFVKAYLAGPDASEIAAEFGVSENAVGSVLSASAEVAAMREFNAIIAAAKKSRPTVSYTKVKPWPSFAVRSAANALDEDEARELVDGYDREHGVTRLPAAA